MAVRFSWQTLVHQFMLEVKELDDLPMQPTESIPTSARHLCDELMQEELTELTIAMSAEDIIGIADGLCDLIYVALYTANRYGIWLDPLFHEIHRSNMTKKGGPKSETGKQMKPDTYEPPNLMPLLLAQQYEVVAYVDDNPTAFMSKDGKVINL